MAETRPSTPAPSDQLPAAWRSTAAAYGQSHPRIIEAFAHAAAAGVDPDDLALIQLRTPRHLIQTMPRLWFGPDYRDPSCRVFSPVGEVSQ